VAKLVVEKMVVSSGRPGTARYKEWRFNPEQVQIVWREANMHEVAMSLCLLVKTNSKESPALAARPLRAFLLAPLQADDKRTSGDEPEKDG
jgi:hypothetical protein